MISMASAWGQLKYMLLTKKVMRWRMASLHQESYCPASVLDELNGLGVR
jgi:hypothetical protein